MVPKTLTIAIGDRPHARPLLRGDVTMSGYELTPVTVEPIISAYRQMVRNLAFDVCELAPVTCLMAMEAGIPICPIPVFLDRRFHHGDLTCAPESGIVTPADLDGRRVGVRAYSVSTGVWGRGVLAEEHGVDLRTITWVVDDDDHLPIPGRPKLERTGTGESLAELLRSSKIDAAFGGNAGTGRAGQPRAGWEEAVRPDSPAADDRGPYPLFDDPAALARASYRRTGIYPLHAVVAIRTELVDRDPTLPSRLYDAFVRSKQHHLAGDPGWTEVPSLGLQQALIAGDPLPFGPEPNRSTLEALGRLSKDQGLIRQIPAEIFPPGEYPPA